VAESCLNNVVKHIRSMAAAKDFAERSDRQVLDCFCERRDEASFSTLVARHGSMVLRVCRRVLQHEQDAEDAYQAVFLVLANRGASIRKRDSLAAWLHGVSYRIALKAKRSAARRQKHECRLPAASGAPCSSPSWHDVQLVLDEEIQRLPTVFRAAFVLCVVEGMTGPRAAAELGIPPGTVASRVARARQIIRARLSRRGIQLGALLAALSVAEAAECALPVSLACKVLLSPANATIPARVTELSSSLMREMILAQVKAASLTLFAIAAALGLGYAALVQARSQKPAFTQSPVLGQRVVEPQGSRTASAPKEEEEQILFSGRVVDPEGKPGAGANIYMTFAMSAHEPQPSALLATSNSEGQFQFKASKAKFGEHATVVAATAPGYAIGWTTILANDDKTRLTIRLAKDDAPIDGHIVDLEGRPVVGAALGLVQIRAASDDNLGPWLEACKNKENLSLQLESKYLKRYTSAVPLTAYTDSTGHVRIPGLGAKRVALLQLEGASVVTQQLSVVTRPGELFEVTQRESNPQQHEPGESTVYHGASFRLAAAPCKPIVGVVRDKDTGKPLAGFEVRAHGYEHKPGLILGPYLAHTTTDEQGRFHLNGVAKRAGNFLAVLPNRELPYCSVKVAAPDTPGLDPVTVDVDVKRGVWIEGRVVDKESGKPVKAMVEYFSLWKNPSLRDYSGFDGVVLFLFQFVETKPDGSYRIAGLPGPGFIVVRRPQGKKWYLAATRRQDEFGIEEPPPSTAPYQLLPLGNYVAFARVEPVAGATMVRRDVTLEGE
jgi:RNA polymerase sigma factor (sigma-70 family)